MIIEEDKVADVDQEQIPMEILESKQRVVAHGDSVSVKKIEFGSNNYYRVANHGDITWENEDGRRLEYDDKEDLELALEAVYRNKVFDT